MVAVLALLGRTLAGTDLTRVAAQVRSAGGWVFVGVVPYALAVLADAVAWQTLLAGASQPALATLVRVRMRCDAFGVTLPGGTLVAESMAPGWLRAAMPIEAGVAAVAGRKCFVGLAESLYLFASFGLGFSLLRARAPMLPWVVLGLAAGMLALFGGSALLLASGSVTERVQRWLAAVPIARVRNWLASNARSFRSTDARLASLFHGDRRRLVAACFLFLVAWSIESLETWVLLRLVGVGLPLASVFAFEASVSLLRSFAWFMPGGLGLQDLGYVAALGALGVPEAATAGAAFLVLKRAKELVWAAVGYATLVPARVPRAGSAAPRLLGGAQ